ncbi:MAG: hypothetical protein ED555_12145 [Allomuricauda sp.]|nr:MAG: hypothetical protein ED555_12145 [Allomuricauda sp.]
MQFKHPEILWALLLLLIPIFIHLFQLRRFKKEAFTNVAMLQKVISESRKSSILKKWLLLLARLGLIAALVIAFAQPFTASEDGLKPMETVIYLDNSFSMQAKTGGMPLLQKAVQELIQNIDEASVFSLFTNNLVFKDITIKDVQNQLLTLGYTQNQYSLKEVQLIAETLFAQDESYTKKLLLFSDFQFSDPTIAGDDSIESHYVQFKPDSEENIAIDSLHIDPRPAGQNNLSVILTGAKTEGQNVPLSLYDGERLIAKSSATFDTNGKASVEFSLPDKEEVDGRLEISEPGLPFDNAFYFNINKPKAIKVLAITEADQSYLQRLFPSDEFDFQATSLSQLNYSSIDTQNLVILDNLQLLPESLRRSLSNFHANGGSLVVIPSDRIDLQSYNSFLGSFGRFAFKDLLPFEQQVTGITFSHPLYQNVFEKNITNFQFPRVARYYPTTSNAPTILAYASGEPFLLGGNRFYLFSASLTNQNSNFKNSPLIVPSFYNMARFSLQASELYFTVGEEERMDVVTILGKDNVLSLSKQEMEIIPRQQTFNTKVSLFFGDNPQEDGIFSIRNKDSVLQKVSFNYRRNESKLEYNNMENLANRNGQNSVAALFDFIRSENEQVAYWKWFVILALVFALAEALIQKYIA